MRMKELAQKVTSSKECSLGMDDGGEDEVGVLTDSFRTMLDQPLGEAR